MDSPSLPLGNRSLPSPSQQASASEDDRAIVARVRAGDTGAYDELVALYGDRLFHVMYHMAGGDAELAAEFTQEAFVRAYERLDRFAGESRFYTWLYRLARNRAMDLMDRKKPVALDRAVLDQAPGRDRRDPGAAVDQAELQAAVQQALGQLPAEQREIILLRDFDGQDYEAIAELLDVPTGTVKSRLNRARAALREAVTPLLGGGWP